MIRLGQFQELKIKRFTSVGAYLNEEIEEDQDILLPKKYLTDEMNEGELINVFVYRDSEDRFVATTKEPMIKIGEFKKLTVKEVGKMGAFLNWGLEKDLFLPFKEQTNPIYKGDVVLVAIYVDKSRRISATMNLYRYLLPNSEYEIDQWVKGFIYDIKKDLGIFVALENKYNGMVPLKEIHESFSYGQEIDVRVIKIRDDGKITVSPREKSYMNIESDSDKIYRLLLENNGYLEFSDNSSPEEIKAIFAMSKKAFKRGIGNLYKEKKIVINENDIRLISDEQAE
jgi:predicted RNA-binding protein (virulence factor B family)